MMLGPVKKQFSISSLQWRGLRLCLFAISMHGLKDKRIIYARISAKVEKRELPPSQSSPALTGAVRTPLICFVLVFWVFFPSFAVALPVINFSSDFPI